MKKIKTTIMASLIGLSLASLASAQQGQPMPGNQGYGPGPAMMTQGTAYGVMGAPQMMGQKAPQYGYNQYGYNPYMQQPVGYGQPHAGAPAPAQPPVLNGPDAPPTPPPPPKIKKVRVLTKDGFQMIPADQL